MTTKLFHRAPVLLTLLFASVILTPLSTAQGATTPHTARASFEAAISSLTKQEVDFESFTSGAPFTAAPGFTLTFTLTTDIPVLEPIIANDYWTSSGFNYLGLNSDDGQFISGDDLTFTFDDPVLAFGLYVIGGEDLQGDDFTLSGAGTDVTNSGIADLSDNDESFAYFIGFNSDTPFESATLSSIDLADSEFFVFAVDDIVIASAVPEASTMTLMTLGLLGIGAAMRRRA